MYTQRIANEMPAKMSRTMEGSFDRISKAMGTSKERPSLGSIFEAKPTPENIPKSNNESNTPQLSTTHPISAAHSAAHAQLSTQERIKKIGVKLPGLTGKTLNIFFLDTRKAIIFI